MSAGSRVRAGIRVLEAILTFETVRGAAPLLFGSRYGRQDQIRSPPDFVNALEDLRGYESSGCGKAAMRLPRSADGDPNWLDERREASTCGPGSRRPDCGRRPCWAHGGGASFTSASTRLSSTGNAASETTGVPLPRLEAAQPDPQQSPALSPVPLRLAHLHPKGPGRELARVLCRCDGDQFLDGNELSRGRVGRGSTILARLYWGANGSERTLRPRHIIMATSVSGRPKLPDIPTLERFLRERSSTPAVSETGPNGRAGWSSYSARGPRMTSPRICRPRAQVTMVQRSRAWWSH